jgi:hypothetical protein
MELRKGSRVYCPSGLGTVVDRDARVGSHSLVRLDSGTVMDMEHGQWWEDSSLTVAGFDPDAMVYHCAGRFGPAGDLLA